MQPAILCIDSYKALLPTVTALLTPSGYKVLTANSVADGLQLVADNHIDMVILDYSLCRRHHHGRECIVDRIRTQQNGIKIVVWCADASVHTETPPCADLVLMKPVPAAELMSQLDSLLRS